MHHGVAYWWNDGSRGQMRQTCGQLVANKTFFEESQRDGQRGMLLARYDGFGSHRYEVFITGDAGGDYDTLALECEFIIRAGGVGISSISHDIGGFGFAADKLVATPSGAQLIDPKLYLRWLQCAVFGPIIRFHSAPGSGSRLPYEYDEALHGACRHWLRVRLSLLPYIYTAARVHQDTGIPLVRGLYLEHPRQRQAYRFDQYYFGPDMIVAPMLSATTERSTFLPAGTWWECDSNRHVDGDREFTRQVALNEVPVYVRAGSLIARQSADEKVPDQPTLPMILDIYAGADGHAALYEDDGSSTAHLDGGFSRTAFQLTDCGCHLILTLRVLAGQPTFLVRGLTLMLSWDLVPTYIQVADVRRHDFTRADSRRWQIDFPAGAFAYGSQIMIVHEPQDV